MANCEVNIWMKVLGTDTNISFTLNPKGTGYLKWFSIIDMTESFIKASEKDQLKCLFCDAVVTHENFPSFKAYDFTGSNWIPSDLKFDYTKYIACDKCVAEIQTWALLKGTDIWFYLFEQIQIKNMLHTKQTKSKLTLK